MEEWSEFGVPRVLTFRTRLFCESKSTAAIGALRRGAVGETHPCRFRIRENHRSRIRQTPARRPNQRILEQGL